MTVPLIFLHPGHSSGWGFLMALTLQAHLNQTRRDIKPEGLFAGRGKAGTKTLFWKLIEDDRLEHS